jgi:hypothetical protein
MNVSHLNGRADRLSLVMWALVRESKGILKVRAEVSPYPAKSPGGNPGALAQTETLSADLTSLEGLCAQGPAPESSPTFQPALSSGQP